MLSPGLLGGGLLGGGFTLSPQATRAACSRLCLRCPATPITALVASSHLSSSTHPIGQAQRLSSMALSTAATCPRLLLLGRDACQGLANERMSHGFKFSSFPQLALFQDGDASRSRSNRECRRGYHVVASAESGTAVTVAPEPPPGASSATSLKNVVDILRERGLVEAVTSEDLRAAAAKPDTAPLKAYVGFDPTAESLHLGNLLGIVVLAWFQRCGHTPVALLGGATARVGDPSGKSVERPIMSEETIERNLSGIRAILANILKAEEGAPGGASSGSESAAEPGSGSRSSFGTDSTAKRAKAVIVNNYDWWKEVSLLDFLRDVGKYARVGTMMAKESVKKRLNSEEGMSYTEFTYQLLQGYDFVHLSREMGVTVQMGGSDQWGNITAGTDLVRRLLGGGEGGAAAHGLTWPLLLKSDGSKFGKSEGGAIWLAPAMLSPYKFYQYLFATPDADVIKFMKMLTFMDLAEVAQYERAMGQPGYVPNTAQRKLAEEVTRFVHGEEGVQEALKATQALAPGSTTKLDVVALEAIAEDIPSTSLPLSSVENCQVIDVSVAAGLFPSKGAARRQLQQGGVYVNNEKVGDLAQIIESKDILGGKMMLLASGKKNKLVVRIQEC